MINKRINIIIGLFVLMSIIYPRDLRSQEENIPQGKMKFEIYFAEWDGRIPNTSCDVVITGNQIKVYKNKDTNLTGGKLIVEGILIKHQSGKWIIADNDAERETDEIGGCTGGPIPIDFKKKIIEWC